jgi:hypothetical protein
MDCENRPSKTVYVRFTTDRLMKIDSVRNWYTERDWLTIISVVDGVERVTRLSAHSVELATTIPVE